MGKNSFKFKGLTSAEVAQSAQNFGYNRFESKKNPVFYALRDTVTEPMFLLLLACASIYFILGETTEAWFMSGAILLVAGISFFQDTRSRRAVEALSLYTKPKARVIRDNRIQDIPSDQIVRGDFIIVSEGEFVPADGVIRHMNDLSVMESILTGESYSTTKEMDNPEKNQLFQGTIVTGGLAIIEATAIGMNTRLGKIAGNVEEIRSEKSPMQIQIDRFVKKMALVGIFCFLLIWIYHYYLTGDIWHSLLQGLTLAMSILPEEIPVAFSTFMALGAWRLLKAGIIVKRPQVIESLGAANVLCIDKTGTITKNQMELSLLWVPGMENPVGIDEIKQSEKTLELIEYAMWASEPAPFDMMEKAIHQVYAKNTTAEKRNQYAMYHEYPLSGQPPMMTHIYRHNTDESLIIARKGAPEAVIRYSDLDSNSGTLISAVHKKLAEQGYRVLAVAKKDTLDFPYPKDQESVITRFLGLIAFYDPPKDNIKEVFGDFEKAGIEIKIVTGDSSETSKSIASQAGLHHYSKLIHADDFEKLEKGADIKAANEYFIFSRMYPELKLKLVQLLKNTGKITGMTGDGVNDGPALKAAHIGIAMGKRGTEIAREAASIILTDDDFSKMREAIAMGRKIHTNLKKAVRYIISIHIAIILMVALPLFLNWQYPVIFTPVHIIFFELIMGPTCSIVYENEPIEKNIMNGPANFTTTNYLSNKDLSLSVAQGLIITLGLLFIYKWIEAKAGDETSVRSAVFLGIVLSNIFLTLVNRSFYYSVFETLKYKNNLLPLIILITVLLTVCIFYIPVFAGFFKVQPLTLTSFGIVFLISIITVGWIEVLKFFKRQKNTAILNT
jgi:Ca2+-transporting ATPase